jgi:two-component system response regulator NreC
VVKIVLADDHHIVRKGLRALLTDEGDFDIVGEAANGIDAVDMVERLSPDILVLDLMMPGKNGLEVAGIISKSKPSTGIIILSMHNDESYISQAFRCGAKAYVLKDNTADELITAIRLVYSGKCYLGPIVSVPKIESPRLTSDPGHNDLLKQLTVSERKIMATAIKGSSNSEIAQKLGISQRTVETHLANLMHKLNISNRSQLTKLSIQLGIISVNEI